jgi:hypothetical protein
MLWLDYLFLNFIAMTTVTTQSEKQKAVELALSQSSVITRGAIMKLGEAQKIAVKLLDSIS